MTNRLRTQDLLKKIIKQIILEGYYEFSSIKPQPTVKQVIDMWVAGDKAYDPDEPYHAFYTPKELWPYREYTWSDETAGGKEVIGIDKLAYQDKWHFIPEDDEGKIVGKSRWDYMLQNMKRHGWDPNRPAYVEVGKNGVAKVGEGNHRLAIARQLGINVPVTFSFKSNVTLSSASNVR